MADRATVTACMTGGRGSTTPTPPLSLDEPDGTASTTEKISEIREGSVTAEVTSVAPGKPSRKRRLRVVKFPKAKVADDSRLIETLVFVLNAARAGKVRGYCAAFIVDDGDEVKMVECACPKIEAHSDRLAVLGMMRKAEHNFIAREWPSDD